MSATHAPRTKRLSQRFVHALVLVVSLVLAAWLLAGCTSPAVDQAGDASGGLPVMPAPDAAPGGGGDTRAEVDGERKVARTASIVLEVPDADAATQRVRAIAEARDGFVTLEQLSVRGEGGTGAASYVTISVPSEQLEVTLADIAAVGTLVHRTVQSEDVTEAVVDIEARIASLEASIARISALMERAGTVAEIATVEIELANRQSQLESLKARQKYLTSITERATITVTLEAPAAASGNPFWSGLLAGWQALGDSARLLLVVLGAVLPFALALALVGLPVLLWLGRRRRHAATTPPTTPAEAAPAATPPAEATPAATPPAEATATEEDDDTTPEAGR